MENTIAKRGSLLQVDSGEYSDYSVHGFFVALDTFDPMTELAAYLEEHPKEKAKYSFKGSGFLAYLAKKGHLLEIGRSRLYLGEYDDYDSVCFMPFGEE